MQAPLFANQFLLTPLHDGVAVGIFLPSALIITEVSVEIFTQGNTLRIYGVVYHPNAHIISGAA